MLNRERRKLINQVRHEIRMTRYKRARSNHKVYIYIRITYRNEDQVQIRYKDIYPEYIVIIEC